MKALAYNQLSGLTAATQIGFSVAGAIAYNPATTYSMGQTATYGGSMFASRVGSNMGNTPVLGPGRGAGSAFWVQVDETTGITVGAIYAVLQAEVGNVRYTEDGYFMPTVAYGMLLTRSDQFSDNAVVVGDGGNPLANVYVINAVASSGALVDVTYYSN